MALTPKQEMFVKEYLIDLNATQAAIRAGYSEKTANEQAARMMARQDVQEAVQQAMDKRATRLEITAESVLQEIAKLAFSNIQDIYNEDGSLKRIHDLPREVAASINSVKVFGEDGFMTKEVKTYDKGVNLERLGKHLKLFTEKTELTGADGGPIIVHKRDMTEEELLAIVSR